MLQIFSVQLLNYLHFPRFGQNTFSRRKLSNRSFSLNHHFSRHMAKRHSFLGTCVAYFEASAFRFPRLGGFWESKRYHCPREKLVYAKRQVPRILRTASA